MDILFGGMEGAVKTVQAIACYAGLVILMVAYVVYFNYEDQFELWLSLVKNTDMLDGKRWPLIVSSFDVKWEAQQSND